MCANDGAMRGMHARMRAMHEQMDRAEAATDPAEQKKLLDLHAKHMREGMREMRRRDLNPECNMEMMSSVMEELVRNQEAMGERGAR